MQADLVPPEILEGDAVEMQCVHGDSAWYPLANVRIQVEGLEIEVEAAISENLPVAVLLGKDVPEFTSVFQVCHQRFCSLVKGRNFVYTMVSSVITMIAWHTTDLNCH